MAKDYYEVLGISKTATSEEINKAYREKALKYHPDRKSDDPNAAEMFKEASQAFEVLSNQQKRRDYDQFGHNRPRHSAGHHVYPTDIFGDLFRDHFRQQQAVRGADFYREIKISLAEAYKGCEQVLDISYSEPCKNCEGTGATFWEACDKCHATGRVGVQRGPFNVSMTCFNCKGEGRISKTRCEECKGAGERLGNTKKQTINIPAGVESDVHVVMRGEGQRVAKGVSGDLICKIIVTKHSFYERTGNDLLCYLPLTFAQSILGHEVEIPVFDKTCKVHVPKGTKSGQILRVKGMGMVINNGWQPGGSDSYKNHRENSLSGDLLIMVQVEVPKKPSSKYLDLVKKIFVLDDKEEYETIEAFNKQIEELQKQENNGST